MLGLHKVVYDQFYALGLPEKNTAHPIKFQFTTIKK